MRSIEKVYATDLTEVNQPSDSQLEQVLTEAKRRIMTGFASSLPSVLKGYVNLATDATIDPDVRRKASDRILDTFVPITGRVERISGTTVQILNAIPLPEIRAVDGRESKTVEIGSTTYALPTPMKRTIQPGDDTLKKRNQFLGPAIPGSTKFGIPDPGSESPRPTESPTPMKKL